MAVVKLQAASFFTISCQVTDQWFWRETIDIFHSATCCAETATFAKFFDCGYNYTHGQYIALCKWPSTLTHQKCMWLMLVPSYWAYLNWLMFPQINAEFCVFYSFILSIHWFIWNLHCVWLVLPARQCLNAYVPFKLHISSIHVMVNKLPCKVWLVLCDCVIDYLNWSVQVVQMNAIDTIIFISLIYSCSYC